jgi:hypothetical protein
MNHLEDRALPTAAVHQYLQWVDLDRWARLPCPMAP